MGVVGLLLLIAAVEIVWAHQFSLEPETDDNGVLTSRGAKRRNQDLIVGTAFILSGGGLVAVALVGLVNPRAVVVVDDDGLRLRIAGPQRSLTIPWDEVTEIRSGREPGDGLRTRAVLLVALRHAEAWPSEYWSARRDGRWLVVDGESWATPPEQVVVHAQLALDAYRRDRRESEEIDQA